MIDFNDKEALRKIDPQDTVASTELAPKQFRAAWEEVQKIEIKDDYKSIKNIVFCGMGASIYGALVLKAIEGRDLPPTELVSDYHLPNYVDSSTLVVLTSYSGTTEEVLSCAEEAKAKGAKMLILTKGGPLAEFAKTNNVTSYIFDGKLNPAGIPRLGNGYTILGLLGLFSKAKIISLEEREIADALTRLEEKVEKIKKQAEGDFTLFINHIPVIFAAEHLAGNG
jgi:glucose/mannose-6-phosphate isomerase